ncbi:uncharacterized protein [Panulirus ornatus]|uniref:uncharacterized protein isoform X1 n=2 Tax=Panulirus ornatus TaxID=150431 RepID=UPI003A8A23E1
MAKLEVVMRLIAVVGVLVGPGNSILYDEDLTCPGQLASILREIRDLLASDDDHCSGRGASGMFGVQSDVVMQALRQHGEVVGSLLAQTESLKQAITSVAEVQTGQQQLLLALKTELEMEKHAKRTQRRTIQDLRSELHTLREESKAWQEHLRRMEAEVKANLQKSEQSAQEVDVEVKEASERTNSLGKVIRRVQRTLQGLERTVNRHTVSLTSMRRRRGRDPQSPTHKLPSILTTETPQTGDGTECPYPFIRIGLGCFTIHSTERYSWEQARQHCRDIEGDLANPIDLYDVVLFLDDSFPESVYSASGGWGFWIGASLDDDGTWHWVSGVPMETQVDFWGRGEPGEALDNDERCLFLHGWWRFRAGADPCTTEKYFICEKKIN